MVGHVGQGYRLRDIESPLSPEHPFGGAVGPSARERDAQRRLLPAALRAAVYATAVQWLRAWQALPAKGVGVLNGWLVDRSVDVSLPVGGHRVKEGGLQAASGAGLGWGDAGFSLSVNIVVNWALELLMERFEEGSTFRGATREKA